MYLTEKERRKRMKEKLTKLSKFVTPELFESMEHGDRYEFTFDFYWSFTIIFEDDNKYTLYIEANVNEDGFQKDDLVRVKAFKPSSIIGYINRLLNELENGTNINLRNISLCLEDSPCNNCLEWKLMPDGMQHGCFCMRVVDKICGYCPCQAQKEPEF